MQYDVECLPVGVYKTDNGFGAVYIDRFNTKQFVTSYRIDPATRTVEVTYIGNFVDIDFKSFFKNSMYRRDGLTVIRTEVRANAKK